MTMHVALRSAATSWAGLAAVWCAAFALLHVYWAFGGDIGLAESAGAADLARQRPTAFVRFGLWGVAGLLTVGGSFWSALARGWPHGRHMRRIAVVVGFVVGALLLVRAAVVEVALLLDASGIASSVGPAQTRWTLWLWNPWLLLGGILFLLASHASLAVGRPDGVSQVCNHSAGEI